MSPKTLGPQTHKLRHLSTEYIATKFSHCHSLRLPISTREFGPPSHPTSATFQPQHRLLGCHGCHIRSSRRHAAHAAAAAEGTDQGSGPGDQRIENAIWTALLRAVQWRLDGDLKVWNNVFFLKSLVFVCFQLQLSPFFLFWLSAGLLFWNLCNQNFYKKAESFKHFKLASAFHSNHHYPSLPSPGSRFTFHPRLKPSVVSGAVRSPRRLEELLAVSRVRTSALVERNSCSPMEVVFPSSIKSDWIWRILIPKHKNFLVAIYSQVQQVHDESPNKQ